MPETISDYPFASSLKHGCSSAPLLESIKQQFAQDDEQTRFCSLQAPLQEFIEQLCHVLGDGTRMVQLRGWWRP